MIDLIAEHERLKKERESLDQKIESLQEDPKYRDAVALKKDIEAVLLDHNKTKDDLLKLFGEPKTKKSKTSPGPKPKKTLPLKRFTNEYTGETVEAKSFKNPTLQKWKNEYGKDVVESWSVMINEQEASASTTRKEEDAPRSSASTPTTEKGETTT